MLPEVTVQPGMEVLSPANSVSKLPGLLRVPTSKLPLMIRLPMSALACIGTMAIASTASNPSIEDLGNPLVRPRPIMADASPCKKLSRDPAREAMLLREGFGADAAPPCGRFFVSIEVLLRWRCAPAGSKGCGRQGGGERNAQRAGLLGA